MVIFLCSAHYLQLGCFGLNFTFFVIAYCEAGILLSLSVCFLYILMGSSMECFYNISTHIPVAAKYIYIVHSLQRHLNKFYPNLTVYWMTFYPRAWQYTDVILFHSYQHWCWTNMLYWQPLLSWTTIMVNSRGLEGVMANKVTSPKNQHQFSWTTMVR